MNSGHGDQASTPVLKEPIHRDELVGLLDDALSRLYPEQARRQAKGDRGQDNPRTRGLRSAQVRYHACHSSVVKFGEFLTSSRISETAIDEPLIRDFERYLKTVGTPDSYIGSHRNQIRRLINRLPSDIRRRELTTMAEFNRAHRWDLFSGGTQELLMDFAKHGRRLKSKSTPQSPVLSTSLLSQPYREQIVKETLTFMRAIGATDILRVTAGDVEEFIEEYDENGKRQAALCLLDYIRPFFRNLVAKGVMATDPLTDIPRKDRRENLDYVPQEGIDKLADLANADMDDFMEVRDRLTAFSLYYDFALRNREGSLLEVHDLDLADHTKISLPKAIQKVQREDSLLFSYFPETTRPLIERYLELRARRNPRTGVLLVSDDGEPLGPDGCRNAVKGLCDRLGIKTYGGKTPTPHRLRHSFGSLNIAPLGRCLDIIEVKEQYRHSSIDTTYRLYVAKNAILKTKRYEARMRANGGGTGNGAGHIHGARQTPDSPPMPSIPIPSPTPDGFIGEDEAVRRVRDLGINYRTLREYGMKTGAVRKNGSGHEYSAEFIAGLANDYFTGQEAMDLLKMPKSSFFRWRNANGVEFIQMGQVGLYRKDLILEQKRRG